RRFGRNENMRLNKSALGKTPGTQPLYQDRSGSPLSSFYRRKLDHVDIAFDKQETAAVTTLDSYCDTKGIDRVDLLKLDVEGPELDALEGSRHLLEARRIRFVSFEFGGANIDSRTYLQDFFRLFEGYGMRLFRITPSGYFREISQYHELHEQFSTTIFFAI